MDSLKKSKRIKAERPAMHEAWLVVLHAIEDEIRRHKLALSGQLPGGSAKKHQHRINVLRFQIHALLNLRSVSKNISGRRWAVRHATYPNRPPICGKPSRHPHLCGCPQKDVSA